MEANLSNLIAWMEQAFVIAALGWLLPILFRIRHPRTQLFYCHTVLALCLILPFAEPWRHPVIHRVSAADTAPAAAEAVAAIPVVVVPVARNTIGTRSAAAPLPAPAAPQLPWTQIVPWALAAGAVVRLTWLLAGLWRIRRYRIGAMPLYPIPESVRAASAVTHADALFCISPHVTGPVMLGWLAPVVLLPESFQSLGEEAQCAIVCHELLHVRRHDWLVTLLEELVAAPFWFNPAIWPLLAQIRLSREELVDSEVVQLTGSRDSYIDALLTIARGQSVSDLAPAPAPLFLRRRHLMRRMNSLLNGISISAFRLLSSYGSIVATLACATWFMVGSLPLVGHPQIVLDPAPPAPASHVQAPAPEPAAALQTPPAPAATPRPFIPVPPVRMIRPPNDEIRGPSVPVPPDPHELAAGSIQPAFSPADRAAAFGLMERAVQNGKMHISTMSPYELKVSFTAGGNVQYTGAGELTETWASGQSWRWTANLSGYSIVRIGSHGETADAQPVSMIPLRIQMLRDAIFWAERAPGPNAMIRTAAAQVNGKPVTCLLSSNMPPVAGPTRLWEEEERCIDNASGELQLYSVAPGTYAVYGYSQNLQFHGRIVPDRITIYTNGGVALDAQVSLIDLSAAAADLFAITPEMRATGPAISLLVPQRFATVVGDVSGTARPVVVHATIDRNGNVIEEEVSAASDPALAQSALDLVKAATFGDLPAMQRDFYINVRFGN